MSLGAGAFALVAWDAVRGQAISLWALAGANNVPDRLIRASEIEPRLAGWLGYSAALFGAPTTLVLILGMFSAAGRALTYPRRRDAWLDMVLIGFTLAYTLLHLLAAFNLYDRYLLPLLIPCALIGARGILWLYDALDQRLPRGEAGFLPFTIALTLLGGSLNLLGGTLPYARAGSSLDTRTGVAGLASWIDAQPLGTILYDRWLGWELDFYLGEWTDKRRVFYSTPDQLAEGALAQPDPAARLFIAPIEEPLALWLAALTGAGFRVTPAEDTAIPRGFRVFWLEPPG